MKVSFVGGWVLVSAALVWIGCAKRIDADEAPPPQASLAAYYPLAVGNGWTYRLNGRDDKRVEVKIAGEEGGYFLDNQGGQLAVDNFGIRDQKRYLLRGPVEAGRSWTNVVSVSSTERYQILWAGQPCEAPAGAFQNCVQVEARNRVDADTTLVNTLTFAAGVGLVRIQVEAERQGRRIPQTWLELLAYEVKPGQGAKRSE
ncbi:hypothetical protein [Stigmatella aurantiaca]|uniref:Conserved uncharacterized protein n=1 Tax=Stigmatella aurantiaca (strain DW4/3-1) TaxID=378806 RepID=E3FYR9_STIAD|nr:hypothetical protein [Stigmatella aurantiaca]ADO72382.1 conserved uncharacterized protein [Stigmatella aurantiaca DW4/3-1]